MTKFQTAAYIMAQSMAANIRAMGMVALNTYRINRNETIAYTDTDFEALLDEFGLHHNNIMMMYQNCEDN